MQYGDDELMIKHALSSVETPEYDILSAVKGKLTQKAVPIKKISLIGIAACLCVMLSIYAMAGTIPGFSRLLALISPDMAQMLQPVEMVCEDNGVRMEILAVGRYANMIKLYVTMQDLTGDRIGKDLSFLDYYSIKGANLCGWSMIDYDERERKATIFVEASNNTGFDGQKLTFKINNIFYDHREYKECDAGIDLTRINLDAPSIQTTLEQCMSWSLGEAYTELSDMDDIPVLKPHSAEYDFPGIKSSKISAIGMIDGKLHVQVWRDKTQEGSGVYIYPEDLKGNKIEYVSLFSFGIDEHGDATRESDYPSYSEYIFDVGPEQLSELKLKGDFWECSRMGGDWSVTFKAEDSGETPEQVCRIDYNGIRVEKVSVNPFGVNLTGKATGSYDLWDLYVTINTDTDNIKIPASSVLGEGYDNNEVYVICSAEKPIDLESVKSVTINGETIVLDANNQ